MGRPCTDRPRVSVCTGTGGGPVGPAWVARGDADGDLDGAGEAGEGGLVAGKAVAVAVAAVAAGEAVAAR
jgi:hypothetical protein